jgi:hypothetical protein
VYAHFEREYAHFENVYAHFKREYAHFESIYAHFRRSMPISLVICPYIIEDALFTFSTSGIKTERI